MNRQFDPVDAFGFGFNSGWQRLLLFFGCCWTGVLVANFCDNVANSFRSLIQGDFASVLGSAWNYFVWSPLTWMGLLFAGFNDNALWIIMLPILGIALLVMLFSDDSHWQAAFVLLFVQPIQALSALNSDSYAPWVCLLFYFAALTRLYLLSFRTPWDRDSNHD